ncbi:hypothetical protein SKAU_G00367480 [Synaphobranchus kaupii]|uniref:Cornifelin n=1 Tax=Synaphobranchus kaupii TaxID=118154 RepID=A0A9Q1EFF3_SYNKA|nr:hypothetical protein SKAU_G00367480 [Synaphobranchus kaupii]
MTTNVIIQQPQAVQSNQWSTGICDCCDDLPVCCLGYWCFPCLACKTTGDFGENCCLPLLDTLWTITQFFGVPICVPPVAFALRVGVRYRYGIEGDMCSDCIYATFCNICSWCQVAREIKRRKSGPAIVNTRPTVITTTTTAPAPQPMFMAPQPMFMAPQPMLMASQPAYVMPQPMSTQSTVVM